MTLRKFERADIPALVLTCAAAFVCGMGRDVSASLAVSSASAWYCVLLYHFAHAGIFHLACNLIALVPFRPRWKTVAVGYICASLAALLLKTLIPGYGPVCGMSALIFALFARRYAAWKQPVWKIILLNVPFLFIPQVDGLLHLLSFFLSYIVWKAAATYSIRRH